MQRYFHLLVNLTRYVSITASLSRVDLHDVWSNFLSEWLHSQRKLRTCVFSCVYTIGLDRCGVCKELPNVCCNAPKRTLQTHQRAYWLSSRSWLRVSLKRIYNRHAASCFQNFWKLGITIKLCSYSSVRCILYTMTEKLGPKWSQRSLKYARSPCCRELIVICTLWGENLLIKVYHKTFLSVHYCSLLLYIHSGLIVQLYDFDQEVERMRKSPLVGAKMLNCKLKASN